MAEKVKITSAKKYGTRYGRTNRLDVNRIESQYLGHHVCPYCKYEGAKRISRGIWGCKKCGSKFTAKAYSLELTKKSEVLKQSEENLEEMFAKDTEEVSEEV